jgi:NitT/TauT family transport system permease protein
MANTETLNIPKGVDVPGAGVEIEDIAPPEKSNRRIWIIRLCSIIFVLGGWEIIGRQIDPLFMSYPTAVFASTIRLIENGELVTALSSSLRSFFISFSISCFIGLSLGLMIGRYRVVEAAADWLVNALYSTPLVAIIPLVILWFGLGNVAKIFIISLLAFFPILINTISGVRNVPAHLVELGNAFGAKEHQIFTKVILPSALPYMMTGVRLGIGRAIIGMVVAEFFTAITGLGALIVKYGNQYDTATMFVPIFVLMFLGVISSVLVKKAEQWIAPWRYVDD